MAREEGNNKDSASVDKLQKRLYQPGMDGVKIRPRSYLHPERVDAPSAWQQDNTTTSMKKKRKKPLSQFSIAQKVFFLSFLVFLFSAGFAFITFYQNKNTISSNNIELAFDHVAFVDGGDELAVSIDVTNRNHAPLLFTNMSLEYPSVTALNDSGVGRDTFALDTIQPGETKTAEFTVVLYGEQGSQNDLRAVFEYRVEGSNAIFKKDNSSLVTLRSTPVDIVLNAREEVLIIKKKRMNFQLSLNLKTHYLICYYN